MSTSVARSVSDSEFVGAGDSRKGKLPRAIGHPWLDEITLPDGLYCPVANRVATRPLRLRKAGRIHLPEMARKSAGWFVLGQPANLDDLDQAFSQELVIESKSQDGQELTTVLGPGDIVAASDFQCWPADIVYDRWRMVSADDVVLVVKQGTKLYKSFLEQYLPFCSETDVDVAV